MNASSLPANVFERQLLAQQGERLAVDLVDVVPRVVADGEVVAEGEQVLPHRVAHGRESHISSDRSEVEEDATGA
jgi:hypothetical protein